MNKFLIPLLASSVLLGATAKFWDTESERNQVVSDRYPLPVRQGLVWDDVVNVSLETCSTDGSIPLNELDTLTAWLQDDGGSFTDDTTDANDAGTGDVQVYPTTPAEDDAVYIGHRGTVDNSKSRVPGKFNAVKFDIGTQGSTSMTVTWEYYNGSSWSALTFVRKDVADFDEATGVHWNTFDPPSDWAVTTVNGVSGWFIRARVSAFTSTATSAVLDQVWLTTLDTDNARQIIVRTDSDETEDIWCKPIGAADGLDADADEGWVIDAGSGALTIEVNEGAGEIICCGDGGASDVSVLLLNHGT